jgi:hypothetical protein
MSSMAWLAGLYVRHSAGQVTRVCAHLDVDVTLRYT